MKYFAELDPFHCLNDMGPVMRLKLDLGDVEVIIETFETVVGPDDYGRPKRTWLRASRLVQRHGVQGAWT